MADQPRSNPALGKEKAEGSREAVDKALHQQKPRVGISNRPLEEEQRAQEHVPPRGTAERQDRRDH